MDNNDLFCISGKRLHDRAAAGRFNMSRRTVWDASIVILFDNLNMIPGANFCLLVQCVFIARKWLVYPGLAIACSYFEIMSTAKAYLDMFF